MNCDAVIVFMQLYEYLLVSLRLFFFLIFSLFKAYQRCNAKIEKESLLSNVTFGGPPPMSKKMGVAMSKNIALFYNARDGLS